MRGDVFRGLKPTPTITASLLDGRCLIIYSKRRNNSFNQGL